MALHFTLILTFFLQRNTLFFLFSFSCRSLCFSDTECSQTFHPFNCIKHLLKAWWSTKAEEAVSERRKTFAVAHRGNEDRQAYISASRGASHVIAKAKAETWQANCSSLSPKSNSKSVFSLLCSVAGSSFSSSSSLNFPNCSPPRESASVFANYLRSHFSVSHPKAFRNKAKGYLSELRRATCPEEPHSYFCFLSSPAEFLIAASNLSSSTATGPDKVAYLMLKHLLTLTYIFSFLFSIFPGLCITFFPSERHLLLFSFKR